MGFDSTASELQVFFGVSSHRQPRSRRVSSYKPTLLASSAMRERIILYITLTHGSHPIRHVSRVCDGHPNSPFLPISSCTCIIQSIFKLMMSLSCQMTTLDQDTGLRHTVERDTCEFDITVISPVLGYHNVIAR